MNAQTLLADSPGLENPDLPNSLHRRLQPLYRLIRSYQDAKNIERHLRLSMHPGATDPVAIVAEDRYRQLATLYRD